MTLLEQLSLPAVIFGGIVVFIVAVMFLRGGRSTSRDTAQMIAAVQAERDVLRAHHAVEVATLEGRLSDAMVRTEGSGDAAFRLKAAEAAIESARTEAAAQKSARMQLSERIAQVTAERDQFAAGSRQAHQLLVERDHAVAEIAAREATIAALETEVQAARAFGGGGDGSGAAGEGSAAAAAELETARADAARQEERAAAASAELEAARADAARQEERAAAAERELAELRQRPEAAPVAAEIARAQAGSEALRRALAERDETILALRSTAQRTVAVGAPGPNQLADALKAAEAREQAANVSLSRLAYDRDGLANRIVVLERAESEARADGGKHVALLELRQQKIYDLDERLREHGTELAETRHRLAEADKRLAGADERLAEADRRTAEAARLEHQSEPQHQPRSNGDARLIRAAGDAADVLRLNGTLGRMREENAALLEELEMLRLRATAANEEGPEIVPRGFDGSAATAASSTNQELEAVHETLAAMEVETARLAAENARLTAEAAGRLDSAEVELLKAQLRQLAERFAAEAEAASPPPVAEPTLAERIRQFREKQRAAAANGSA